MDRGAPPLLRLTKATMIGGPAVRMHDQRGHQRAFRRRVRGRRSARSGQRDVRGGMETSRRRRRCEPCATRALSHGHLVVPGPCLPMARRRVVLVARAPVALRQAARPVKKCSERTDAIASSSGAHPAGAKSVSGLWGVGRDGHSVVQLARPFGMSWHPARGTGARPRPASVDHLSRLRLPAAIGPTTRRS